MPSKWKAAFSKTDMITVVAEDGVNVPSKGVWFEVGECKHEFFFTIYINGHVYNTVDRIYSLKEAYDQAKEVKKNLMI